MSSLDESQRNEWSRKQDAAKQGRGGGPTSTSDGGGPTSSEMEARVKALEDKFDKIDGKLNKLIEDGAYMKGKVDSMPTTLQLGGFVIAVLAVAGLAKYLAP